MLFYIVTNQLKCYPNVPIYFRNSDENKTYFRVLIRNSVENNTYIRKLIGNFGGRKTYMWKLIMNFGGSKRYIWKLIVSSGSKKVVFLEIDNEIDRSKTYTLMFVKSLIGCNTLFLIFIRPLSLFAG